MSTEHLGDLLSEEEREAIVSAFGRRRGDAGFTEEEAAVLFQWAGETRLFSQTLQLIVEGKVLVDVREGEPVFFSEEVTGG